jgi:hypothetical protein
MQAGLGNSLSFSSLEVCRIVSILPETFSGEQSTSIPKALLSTFSCPEIFI